MSGEGRPSTGVSQKNGTVSAGYHQVSPNAGLQVGALARLEGTITYSAQLVAAAQEEKTTV
jgi:hypothetical protein